MIAALASILVGLLLHWAGLIKVRWVAIGSAVVTALFAAVAAAVYRVHSRRPVVGLEALIGARGVVIEPSGPTGEVLVEVEGELWRAIHARGEMLARGERVKVVGHRGLVLIVEKEGD